MLCQLIILTGPTAVGKTATAIHLAQQIGAEIISADSRQLYRYMDIATAKPSPAEQGAVAHHGLDLLNPDEIYSAGAFVRFARQALADIWSRGKAALVVGGTGLYIQAFLDGLWADEGQAAQVREELQARLGREGLEALYGELGRLDPVAQAQVARRDTQRVLRTLEIATTVSRRAFSWDPMPVKPPAFCLCRPRGEQNQRIDERVEAMAAQGLVAEAERLVGLGYHRGTRAMQSLGYEELLDYLESRCTLDQALAQVRTRTRQFAKRQLTWFRKDRRYRWLDLSRWGNGGAVERVLLELRNQKGL